MHLCGVILAYFPACVFKKGEEVRNSLCGHVIKNTELYFSTCLDRSGNMLGNVIKGVSV